MASLFRSTRCFVVLLLTFYLLIACGQKVDPAGKSKSKYGGVLYFGPETLFHSFDVLNSGGVLIPSMSTPIDLIQEPPCRMNLSTRTDRNI